MLLTSSVLHATVRLARRKVLAQQLYCIETLARVDVLCLDKTAPSLGRMEVEGTYPLPVEGVGLAWTGERLFPSIPRCSTLRSPTWRVRPRPMPTRPARRCSTITPIARSRCRALSVIPFSSSKKWSGASFAQGSYVMGAAQFVLSDRVFSQVENRVAELADTCRVLVVARVDGFTPDGDMVGEAEPVGFVTIRDEIRTSAAETIGYFNEQGVTLNVISGDDPRTVSSIARVVGIPGADAYVDATTLDTPAKLDAAVDRYHVFGRVTPQQKRELVQALKRRDHTVAMTGDGVNDVLALKEADCSVAMAAGSMRAQRCRDRAGR
ncbi:MAG: HAD-IC family P-type ATPase [Collinsella sp.]